MTTEQKYDLYISLLGEWNQKMNLVAPGTLADARTRHIADSAQLADFIPAVGPQPASRPPAAARARVATGTPAAGRTIVDLGSGAGFPAVVLAILGRRVIAIESVAKKCRFLEELKERLDLPNLEIINDRVESALPRLFRNEKSTPAGGFVFTARAFAPLIKILDLTARFAKKYSATYALLKGRTAEDEIAVARSRYDFDAVLHPSKTGDGRIIILTIK